MVQFLDDVTQIVNALISWVSTLSNWMIADILMGFVLSIVIFTIPIKIFRRIKKII